jgi:hypothetical protein
MDFICYFAIDHMSGLRYLKLRMRKWEKQIAYSNDVRNLLRNLLTNPVGDCCSRLPRCCIYCAVNAVKIIFSRVSA